MRAPNPESRSAMVQQVQIVPEGAALFSLSRSRYSQIVLRYSSNNRGVHLGHDYDRKTYFSNSLIRCWEGSARIPCV